MRDEAHARLKDRVPDSEPFADLSVKDRAELHDAHLALVRLGPSAPPNLGTRDPSIVKPQGRN
jgi:hypothetical protein